MTLNRGNKLFEGSRMVLPEHRKRIRDRSWEEHNLVEAPVLDEQGLEDLQYAVMTAIEEQHKVEVIYYADRQRFSRTGVIVSIDAYAGVLKMEEADGTKAFVPLAAVRALIVLE